MSGDFRIAGWMVQPALNRLQRGGEIVRLEPKVMQVLLCLAERSGEVATREELIARVWPDVHVTDDVLHRAVRELRRVFGDDAANPRAIETIRKRGYRLLAPVEDAADPVAADAAPIAEAPRRGADAAPVESAPARTRHWSFAIVAASLAVICAAIVLTVVSRPDAVGTEASARFVPLTSGPLNETDAAIAPDGRTLAFVTRQPAGARGAGSQPGDPEGQADIFLLDASRGTEARLTENPGDDRLPAWSPDGRRLAFLRATPSNCDVVIMTIDDRRERIIGPCTNREEPRLAWADGESLLMSLAPDSAMHHGWQIIRVALGTGERRVITTPPAGVVGDHSPAVSPDGRTLAFVRYETGGVADVWVVPLGGGAERRVTWDDADIAGVDWTEGGRALVYSSDRAGGYTLWRIPAHGGPSTPQMVAGGAARLKHPVATRDGSRIVYESWNYEINIWEVGLEPFDSLALAQGRQGRQGRQAGRRAPAAPEPPPRAIIRRSDLWNLYPQLSPDVSRLAYVSNQSGSQELWIANRDGSGSRQLTRFGRAALRVPRWSPDGRHVAVVAHTAGNVDLFVVDAQSGDVRQLTADPAIEIAPAWSPDGATLLVGGRRDGRWHVWSVPVGAASPAPRLVIENAYAAQAAPDGELYFTRPDRAGLWRVPAQGGEPSLVTDRVPAADWANWRVTASGVFFVVYRRDEVMLWQAARDGRDVHSAARLDNLSWPGIDVTPDGRRVLYARWDRRESNIMAIDTVR